MALQIRGGKLITAQRKLSTNADCCCTPTGACCTSGVCSIKTEADCIAHGGIYQGDSTTCDGVDCTAACPSTSDIVRCDFSGISSCCVVEGGNSGKYLFSLGSVNLIWDGLYWKAVFASGATWNFSPGCTDCSCDVTSVTYVDLVVRLSCFDWQFRLTVWVQTYLGYFLGDLFTGTGSAIKRTMIPNDYVSCPGTGGPPFAIGGSAIVSW